MVDPLHVELSHPPSNTPDLPVLDSSSLVDRTHTSSANNLTSLKGPASNVQCGGTTFAPPSCGYSVSPTSPKGRPFTPSPSTAGAEWNRLKSTEGAKNAVLDRLMNLTGLESVKEWFLVMFDRAHACKQQGGSLECERFHAVFQGNPGTGKTTVARLYASFLCSIGKLTSPIVQEISGSQLACMEPWDVDKMIQNGGVILVDEAYQLTAPYAPDNGRRVLDILLMEMENRLDKLVVVFIGYNRGMGSFFQHNPGLQSRISYSLDFTDYTDWELWSIMAGILERKYGGRMRVEGGIDGLYMRVCVRRIGRCKGFNGFGNARTVETTLQRIMDRQSRRLNLARRNGTPLTQQDYLYLTKEDLIGKEPSVVRSSEAWERLQELVGLESVKNAVDNLIHIVEQNYWRELSELEPLEFMLNRVFVGSPGTGKTTVAKLYGQIMADLGFLTNGDVVITTPADFNRSCPAQSEAQTKEILNMTRGKVLIIDDAHMLHKGGRDYIPVIDTLVTEIQGVPGDDRCVLLLGSEDKLRDMFLNVNDGLQRLFQGDNPIHFENYNSTQLIQILGIRMKDKDLKANELALQVAADALRRSQMKQTFSNACEVEALLAAAKVNCQTRTAKLPHDLRPVNPPLEPEDFDPNHIRVESTKEAFRKLLEGKIANSVIDELANIQVLAERVRTTGNDARQLLPTTFIFQGNQGTGKTFTARQMGQVFYDIGLLSTPEIVECSISSLVKPYIGRTALETQAVLDRALGKTLIIEDAHHLCCSNFAMEACNQIVDHLAQEKNKGRMVIIFAGFRKDMLELMQKTALAGHVRTTIEFPNIPPADCIALLRRELETGFKVHARFLEDDTCIHYQNLLKSFQLLSLFPTWQNSRNVKRLSRDMAAMVFGRSPFRNSVLPMELEWNDALEPITRLLHEFRSIHDSDLGESTNTIHRRLRWTPGNKVNRSCMCPLQHRKGMRAYTCKHQSGPTLADIQHPIRIPHCLHIPKCEVPYRTLSRVLKKQVHHTLAKKHRNPTKDS
ncbi:P-loop containing nucleoside triphosphate hydrolase protein [Kalaharituber pfeilii]|nr:P-loop containing nucleoside triphosphate hydrolase protein [Kalaharituber pfeilii]